MVYSIFLTVLKLLTQRPWLINRIYSQISPIFNFNYIPAQTSCTHRQNVHLPSGSFLYTRLSVYYTIKIQPTKTRVLRRARCSIAHSVYTHKKVAHTYVFSDIAKSNHTLNTIHLHTHTLLSALSQLYLTKSKIM